MATVSTAHLMLGVATSATQIEGGERHHNWYDWAQLPGRVRDGSSPARATDHWERWREDTALMAELGMQTYRMGLEWSRIEPRPGEFSTEAIDHYRAEIGALVDVGIRPLVTLHHFSQPSWFQGLGEWTIEESIPVWLRFVRHTVAALGDLVSDWVTINEPNVYAVECHLWGEGPPGTRSWMNARRALRHMTIAHIRAYRLIHRLQPHAQVGFAHHLRRLVPRNPRNPWHVGLTRGIAHVFQDALSDGALAGRFGTLLGPRPADITEGRHYDYLGINYYGRTAVSRLADDPTPGAAVNDLGWEIHPEGLVEVAADLHRRHPGPIWVTENGTCDNGHSPTGRLERFRGRYLADHLTQMASSDLPFERYHHWCFVDNWEWSQGEAAAFGLVHNDFATQTRTVKPSGRLYADIIASGAITDDLLTRHVPDQHYDRWAP